MLSKFDDLLSMLEIVRKFSEYKRLFHWFSPLWYPHNKDIGGPFSGDHCRGSVE